MNRLPSPSSYERVSSCLISEVLPHTIHETVLTAAKGTTIHRYLALCIDLRDPAAAVAQFDEADIPMLEAIDINKLPATKPEEFAAEMSFAFNPWTEEARILGYSLEREEAWAKCGKNEVAMTADVVGVVNRNGVRTVIVWDYKSGHGYVQGASENWQTSTYMLAAARALNCDAAEGGIIRANESLTWYDETAMGPVELATHAAELRKLLDYRARAIQLGKDKALAKFPPREGRWCRYCPAAFSCPPRLAIVQALAGGAQLTGQMDKASPEQLRQAVVGLKNAEKMLELGLAYVKDLARRSPIDMGEGRVYGEVIVAKETMVPERAKKVLADTFGAELGQVMYGTAAVTETSITFAALKKALARYAPRKEKEPLAPIEKALREDFRAAGAVSVREERQVKEHKPKDEAEEAVG
jgi:hypothetical protein